MGGSLGGNDICLYGFIGAMCEVCDIDNVYWGDHFSMNNEFKCGRCEDLKALNFFRIVGIMIF